MAKLHRSYWLVCFLTISLVGCESSPRDFPGTNEYAPQTHSQNVTAPNVIGTPTKSLDLGHLRKWVGKYPVNPNDKDFKNFFEIPEVKSILTAILKDQGFKDLILHFSGTDLISEKDGFLVMLGTSARDRNRDVSYGLIALNPDTGETHVFFSDMGKNLTGFSNTNGDGNLTPLIKQEILAQTEGSVSDIIGTLKNRPTEGFFCYATSPKDSNVKAADRRYIFVNSDNGGIFNIEGTDIELNEKGSVEKKGENGQTFAQWMFANQKVMAKFDLAVEKSGNEGSDTLYNGTLTVTTMTKTQTIQVKAFCGG